MMFNSSFAGMPYYSRYSRYGYRYPYYSYKNHNNTYTNNSFESKKKDIVPENNAFSKTNKNFKNTNATKNDDTSRLNASEDLPLFQILGLNLYFDDILLICLILFLYQEGVEDEGLFIALILLLLS